MTPDDYLARARALLPALAERARDTEQLRRLTDETVKDFESHGLLRAVQPRRWGGLELDLQVFYDAIMAVGSVCGSSSWTLGVVGIHAWQLALFPERAQEDVWGADPNARISSSYAPTGRVERAPGGYRISGTWSFSSGCDLCQWVFLGGVVPDSSPPDMRTFLLPRSDYRIDDNWHVAGLSGSGSKNIAVEDAFVPEHRTHRFADAFAFTSPGQKLNPGPLYRLPFGTVFAYTVAVPAIGVAQGALDGYTERTRTRFSLMEAQHAAEDPFAQMRLADAATEIDSVRARLRENVAELSRLAEAAEPIPVPVRARCRRDSAQAVARMVRAVDLLFEVSGGHAIFLDQPIQRAWRDVHAMRAHFINNPDKAGLIFARSELGVTGSGGSAMFL